MPTTNTPKTPSHDDPARKQQEDKRLTTNQATNQGKTITPDKAHDKQR